MGLRICLVTPFAWSQPHDVNEHVAGIAHELRALGHSVTILASSNRARDLAAGRRALLDGLEADVVALGPAVPISRRSRIAVPVGARANLSLALALGRFDVVHGFEPGLPSLSYLALRDAQALAVATFVSAERLGYPLGRAQRDRLLARLDALLATSRDTADAAAVRFPGAYRVVSPGFDPELFAPGAKRRLIVVEWRPAERALTRSVIRALEELEGWELVVLRTKPLMGRPTIRRDLRERVSIRSARDGRARAPLLREAAVFVPGLDGLARVSLEAAASGCAIVAPPGVPEQPELAGAEVARLAENETFRVRRQRQAVERANGQTFADAARELDSLYRSLARRRRTGRATDPLSDRDWILADLHLHTKWSHDCIVEPADLVMYAEAIGLGAIAVTDHNAIGGARDASRLVEERELIVIPAEEVKTDSQGEVIGLFLEDEIPRGLSFADTVAAIRDQGGLVYLPHPFDRLHAIPDAATIHRHLADIDVFEVYNARLLFDAYNDEAVRFAAKYNLTVGAGSDAHVLQGVGTGVVRMRRFEGPEEFLLSLRTAHVVRRPRSLVYLQGLKWMAQAKERVR
jgi:predicted metal-dependent phosphoesterase TrpH/glycosyltransferase involved in cell wall biosynthesis